LAAFVKRWSGAEAASLASPTVVDESSTPAAETLAAVDRFLAVAGAAGFAPS
jgi:hypothetical protein